MRKKWEEPRIMVQQFEANEYVAACGDTEYGNYKFVCNAGELGTSYAIKDAEGKYLRVGWRTYNQYDWYYTPCGETHESPTNADYIYGYHLDNRNTTGDENIQVIIWTDGGTNMHCTTNLNQDSWEMDRS